MKGRDVEISVLGSVSVQRDGAEIDLGPRLRRVFATLLADHDSVVSVDRLIDSVWLGEPPDGADTSVKTYITRLRRAIDPDREGLITYHAPGYVLRLNGYSLDSELFDAELDEAAQLLRTADDEAAVAVVQRALGRWHGDAYAGFADEEWARPVAVRLEERRLEAVELLIDARLGSGDVERAVAEAEALAEAAPLRERPRVLLMRALYAAGRQADALREFRSFRCFLVEEAGLDPSAALVELEGRIARSDPSLAGAVRALRGYELHERIGEGAFAVVHRAVQPGIERDVAVKIIRSELADRPEFVRRFEHEAQVVATVEHPHVVPLYDYWREPGAAYLVMRLLRGGSVEGVLRARGPFSQRATADLLREVGGALEAAHRKGVVHRDVRPANLLLDEDGTAYLADFGIALPVSTADDVVVASPAYASPEVLRGEPAGVAADVLSLGVTTFELLTGRLPFADSDSRGELIRRQLAEPLPSACATRTDLPPRVDDILARATAKVPADRYATIAALVDDLVETLDATEGARRSADVLVRGAPVENPYVGLHAFGEADADRFFGREGLVTELVESLAVRPFVVVVGPSGSGKSSVVRAGLVPALRRGAVAGSERWFMTGMMPGSDPIDALETALLRVAVNPPASLREQLAEPGGLLRAIRRVLPDDDTRLLLVIDQLEELFTMADPDEQDRFLTELAVSINEPGSPVRVVATLRADHYDVPLRHRAFAELATAGTVTIRPMSPGELERVVVRPVAALGVEVEPALVADLVAGVSERPAALPLLQFALTETFERRVSDLMLASTYADLGGLTGAVAARADRIVDAGGAGDEAETRRIFGRLVTLGEGVEDTRRRALRREFGDGERTAWLLDAFVSARLLTLDRDEATREPTVEVAHEALLRDWPRLRGWLAEDREDLRTMRTIGAATEAWIANGRDDGELARGGRLATVTELAERRPDLLNERETDWVAASTAAAAAEAEVQAAAAALDRRQNRRLRQLLVVAAVLVVVAVVAALVAVVLRNRAVDSEQAAVALQQEADTASAEAEASAQQATEAEADANIERIAALSAAQANVAPDVSILLALEANRRRDDADTQAALQRAIAAQPTVVDIFPALLDGSTDSSFSRDGTVGVTWTRSAGDGRLQWFDPRSGASIGGTYEPGVGIIDSVLSGDGTVTAVATGDGAIRFVDLGGDEIANPYDVGSTFMGMSLDKTGDRILVSTVGSTDTPANLIVAEVVDVGTGGVISTYGGDELSNIGSARDPFRVALTNDGSFYVIPFEGRPGIAEGGLVADAGALGIAGYDIVDATTGARRERVEGERRPSTLALSATDRLVLGYEDGSVHVRDVRRSTPPFDLVGLTSRVAAVGAGRDGTIAAAGEDGVMLLWSAEGTDSSAPVRVGGRATDLMFGPDGAAAVALTSSGFTVVDPSASVMVDVDRRTESSVANLFSDHPYYASARPGGAIGEFRRLSDDSLLRADPFSVTYPGGFGAVPFYSSDGEWFLTAPPTIDGPFVVAEIGGDRLVQFTFDLESAGVPYDDTFFSGLRPAPGGERVIMLTGPPNGVGYALWIETATGDIVDGAIELAAAGSGPPLVLPDGRVVTGGDTSTVRILAADLDNGWVVVDGTDGFRVFDQDENSGRVLIGSSDGRVGLVDVDAATVEFLESTDTSLRAGAFSPDGRRVAVLSEADGIQLLDVGTGRTIGVPMPPGRVTPQLDGVRWAEDGSGVWIAHTTGVMRFAADPAGWREIACGIVHREFTAEEWRTFVSEIEPQVAACL